VNAEGDASGTDRVRIESRSPLIGQTLRQSRLPISIIVTTILRKRDLVVPNGSTVLKAGDELVLIGRSSDVDELRTIAGGTSHVAHTHGS
jgi:Trk K+ transport system NAD-binding subunit